MAPAGGQAFDLALDAAPLFSVPGRTPEWPWRAPGGVDRALGGAAARRLYPPGALHEACRLGDAAAVAAALDAGAEVDAQDEGGHTLLHFAAGFEQLPVVALLLERGAALELRDKWGKAPVDWALQAEAHAAVALLRREAEARGCASGRGEAAPLATCTEHHHGCTNEEMAQRLAAVTALATGRLAKTEKSERESGQGSTAAVRLPYDADSVRARLAAVRAAAAAQVAPQRL